MPSQIPTVQGVAIGIIRNIVEFETRLGSVSPLWYRSSLPFKEERDVAAFHQCESSRKEFV